MHSLERRGSSPTSLYGILSPPMMLYPPTSFLPGRGGFCSFAPTCVDQCQSRFPLVHSEIQSEMCSAIWPLPVTPRVSFHPALLLTIPTLRLRFFCALEKRAQVQRNWVSYRITSKFCIGGISPKSNCKFCDLKLNLNFSFVYVFFFFYFRVGLEELVRFTFQCVVGWASDFFFFFINRFQGVERLEKVSIRNCINSLKVYASALQVRAITAGSQESRGHSKFFSPKECQAGPFVHSLGHVLIIVVV